jgi:hypothetical protein
VSFDGTLLMSCIEKYTNETTFSAAYSPSSGFAVPAVNCQPLALKINRDGGDRWFYFGIGPAVMGIHSTAYNDFLIPDQVGIFLNANNAAAPAIIMLVSFEKSAWTP